MNKRGAGLALPVVIGIGLAVASCSSAPVTGNPAAGGTHSASGSPAASAVATPAAPSPAASIPAGYTRVGGAAQGISIAAPSSWVAIDLAKDTIAGAARKLGVSGLSAATLIADMQALQKLHAVIIYDVKAAVDNPQHFAPNLNAYCAVSGVTDVGAAGVPLLREQSAAEFAKVGATHVTQQDIQVGGVPGVENSYQIRSAGEGTIDGSQLEVLPKPDKLCIVTVTTVKGATGQFENSALGVAAATAQFP